jgi:hypothetical protein
VPPTAAPPVALLPLVPPVADPLAPVPPAPAPPEGAPETDALPPVPATPPALAGESLHAVAAAKMLRTGHKNARRSLVMVEAWVMFDGAA